MLPDRPALEARAVGESAETAVLSLDVPRDRAFTSLYDYLAVDEPAVHLMPLHFLPRSPVRDVGSRDLHLMAVAAKLEYVRSRWIDEIVDSGCMDTMQSAHRLHADLVELIFARYVEALRNRRTDEFFRTLAGLYAHHGASLAVDGSRSKTPLKPLARDEYSAQVYARNGSFRASVDAVLMLAGASAESLRTARQAWHLWILGAQLYDDALDVEEDFESECLTWTVARTLADLGADAGVSSLPDRDAFYEAALIRGAVLETLAWAESCFRRAADLADAEFPGWTDLQRGCLVQTSKLREDFRNLIVRSKSEERPRRER